jgi:hypothetical protein
MPIRINLLAEAQAAEELRRKDPVKRGAVLAVLLVLLELCWSSTRQVKIMAAKGELNSLESKWQAIEKNYQKAVDNHRKELDAEEKLAALQQYTTNRLLWGTTLNAFQQTLMGVDQIQVVRLKTEQSYVLNEEAKKPSETSKPGAKAVAASTEKVNLTIEALDFSPQPGGQVNKFKEAITTVPYFHQILQKTNGVLLTSLSAPQLGPAGRTPYVLFTLQCFLPEKVRN